MPERILVIDDEKAVRESSVALLTRRGYEAYSAGSGQEALELIQKESFDLLLLDVRMPGMDGIEVLRQATELVPDIQVVMLTGHGTMDTAIEALEYGAIGFLRKPVTIEDLQISIKDALARGSTRRENARLTSLLPLFKLNEQLLSEIDEEKIIDLILKTVNTETGADTIEVIMQDTAGNLTRMSLEGVTSVSKDNTLRHGEDIIKKVSDTMKPLVYSINDGKIHENWDDVQLINGGYEIYIPLIARDKTIGIMKIGKTPPHKPLRFSELDFLFTLCGQGSIAISNSRLYESLVKAHLEVEDLLKRVITNTEDERLRISLELHDGPIQSIAASQFAIQACRALLDENPDEVDKKLQNTGQVLLESTHQLRRIVSDLHPPDLEKSGLIAAIQEYLSIIENERQVNCHIKVRGEPRNLKYDTERAIYYIVREAITNSKKHADASTLEVILEYGENELFVSIRDDGIGFNPLGHAHNRMIEHVGLRSINERARVLQAELNIDSEPGKGTVIGLVLPLAMHVEES
jgi:signal transduction histidine kinase